MAILDKSAGENVGILFAILYKKSFWPKSINF